MSEPFSPKDPSEIIILSWDFGPVLAPLQETIESTTWEIIDPEDESIDLTGILVDQPTHQGTISQQTVAAGVEATFRYRITCTTNLGNVYVEKPTQLFTSE